MPKSLDLDSLARRRPLSQALESWPLSQTPSHHHSSRPSSRSDQPSSTPTSASHHPPSPNPSAYSLNLSPATFPSDRLGAQAISPIITCHFGERVCVWGGGVLCPAALVSACPLPRLSAVPSARLCLPAGQLPRPSALAAPYLQRRLPWPGCNGLGHTQGREAASKSFALGRKQRREAWGGGGRQGSGVTGTKTPPKT